MGRIAEAQEALHKFMDEHSIGPQQDETPALILSWLLEAAVLIEDKTATETLAIRLRELAPYCCSGPFAAMTPVARLLGDASALLNKPDEARAYYQQALEVAEKIRNRPEIALTHLGLAELLLEHCPDERQQAVEHLDFAIAEFRDMKMQPSLERALRHRDILKA